jgi:ZIP family zinc transporter
VSLALGVGILALAVLFGGLAALFRGRAQRLMAPIRTFAVVAAAAIAVFHLLPESIDLVGLWALVAAGVGLAAPAALERAFPAHGGHTHHERAPTTALAIGYAAVLAHQLGEGAAVATLARTGALTPSIVLAIAAHTVPLAMVVAIGVLEAKGKAATASGDATRTTLLALGGIALATTVGALLGNLLGAATLALVEPWILATVAGLLLHALAHDARPTALPGLGARATDALAGLGGLAVATAGIEPSGWLLAVPASMRSAGLVGAAGVVVARSLFLRARAEAAHGHGHEHERERERERDGHEPG